MVRLREFRPAWDEANRTFRHINLAVRHVFGVSKNRSLLATCRIPAMQEACGERDC